MTKPFLEMKRARNTRRKDKVTEPLSPPEHAEEHLNTVKSLDKSYFWGSILAKYAIS